MRFKEYYLREMIGKKYEFSCLLIDFPPTISKEIMNWTEFNIKDEVLAGDGRENQIHATLIYGLHDSDPWTSRFLLKDVKPFEITLGKMGKFSAPDNDVLKIDVEQTPELMTLREYLEGSLDNTQTHHEYRPHVTLAFVKSGSCDKFLGNDLFQDRKIIVNEISFCSKDGTRQRITLS
jgi:2'-5' RNA ligase superfamily